MVKKIHLLFFFFSFFSFAQTNKIVFEYDLAGNQKQRILCLNCPSTSGKNVNTKALEELTSDDFLTFSEEDIISYYPNPVKEELYLMWRITQEKYVNNIQIFSINAQQVAAYQNISKKESLNIPFQNYSAGVYMVVLYYNTGDQKSIKIIKQ